MGVLGEPGAEGNKLSHSQRESQKDIVIFLFSERTPVERGAGSSSQVYHLQRCRMSENQRMGFLGWTGYWRLSSDLPSSQNDGGGIIWRNKWKWPPCWSQATGKGMSQGSALHQGCRPPTLIITGGNPLRRLEEQVCVWWHILQGDGKNLESSNKIPQSNQLASQPTNTKVSKSHHVRSRHSESPNWPMYSGSLHKWDFCSFGGLWVSEA